MCTMVMFKKLLTKMKGNNFLKKTH